MFPFKHNLIFINLIHFFSLVDQLIVTSNAQQHKTQVIEFLIYKNNYVFKWKKITIWMKNASLNDPKDFQIFIPTLNNLITSGTFDTFR